MARFIPRTISADQAAEGFNNEGRGELLGYVAKPDEHETTCRYRISTGGDPDKQPHESCTCRIGLWREKTPAQKVVDDMRKTSKRVKRVVAAKPKKRMKTKPKSKRAKSKNPSVFRASCRRRS